MASEQTDLFPTSAEQPLISVVVPVYNVEAYLREAMDSLLAQTYRNLEIICVNDGSTDGSPDILREYARRDARLHIINRRNGGYGKAMNTGLEAAHGEWLAIFEPDDILPPNAYERLLHTAKGHEVDIVKGAFAMFSENVQEHSSRIVPKICGRVFSPAEMPEYFFGSPATWAALYHIPLLQSAALHYNETPGASYQDVGMYFLSGAYAKRMICTEDCVYYYRTERQGSSITMASSKAKLLIREHEWIRATLEQDPTLWERLQGAFVYRTVADFFYFFKRMDGHGERLAYLQLWQPYLQGIAKLDHSRLTRKMRRRIEAIRRNPELYLAGLEGKGGLFYRHSIGLREFRFFGIPVLRLESSPHPHCCKIFGITVRRSRFRG